MIKLYIGFFISAIFCFALTSKSEAQEFYVQNQSLSIHKNGVLAVFDDIILDSARISGAGNLYLVKKGIQKITGCHSSIANIEVSEVTTLKIIGDVEIGKTNTKNKLKALANEVLDDVEDNTPLSKKKIAEKPRVENQPMKAGLRPSSANSYGILQCISLPKNYYYTSLPTYNSNTDLYILLKPDTDYTPPEQV